MRRLAQRGSDIGKLLGQQRVGEILAVDFEQHVGAALEIEAQSHRPGDRVLAILFCQAGGRTFGNASSNASRTRTRESRSIFQARKMQHGATCPPRP